MIFLYNFEAAIFRSVGDTKVPLQALALSGVAIATVISNAVSALILFYRLLRTDKWIRLQPAKLRISGECLGQILRIAWVYTVFQQNRTFHTIMMAYPASLATTAVLIFIALIIYRPSKRYQELEKIQK